jgi:hypothetical protein
MSNFSVPTGSYTISSSPSVSTGTITIPSGGYSSGSSDTITISNITMNSGTTLYAGTGIGGGAGTGYEWSFPEEWEGCFPDWSRVQDMCKQYPALKIAFEKFKTTYQLVQDHYDTPENERPLP